ncbi:hypothetical protein LMG28138_04959 [Pararobbsia alpina]|uniref:Uncharacterized protein n=1 Tax=Pararobbsia alpina TaxID=621374 RepID=A0A6S7BIV8_9BURK|nr:hypothetical protein LMG28138_04959 [Pararobbsia alpina]
MHTSDRIARWVGEKEDPLLRTCRRSLNVPMLRAIMSLPSRRDVYPFNRFIKRSAQAHFEEFGPTVQGAAPDGGMPGREPYRPGALAFQ